MPVPDRCPLREAAAAGEPARAGSSACASCAADGIPGRRGLLVGAVAATFGDIVDDYFARALFSTAGRCSRTRSRVRGGGLRGGSYAVLGEELFGLRRFE